VKRSARTRSLADVKWAILISGRGSNLQAILDSASAVDVRLVVSSKASAPGLLRAKRMGVPTLVLPKKIDWIELDRELRSRGIDRVFLAGFMKIVPAEFVAKWEDRIVNVHPSLLPAYPGLNAIESSHAEGADMGVTVHVVTPEMDAGPRLLQRRCSVAEVRASEFPLAAASLLISRAEQRLVREAVVRWH